MEVSINASLPHASGRLRRHRQRIGQDVPQGRMALLQRGAARVDQFHVQAVDDAQVGLRVQGDALAEEQAFMDACFADEAALAAPGGEQAGALYCDRMAQRYADSAHLRFLLRTAYLPPATLRIEVGTGYEALLAQLQQHYVASLGRFAPTLAPQRIDLYAQAYLGIVDSLHVELIYAGGAALQQRHAALWHILSDSLAMAAQSA